MIDLPEGLYEVDQAYLVDVSRNRLSLRNVTFLWLKEPVIQAGKVFEPATESSCIFTVGESISPVSLEQYLELTGLQELDSTD